MEGYRLDGVPGGPGDRVIEEVLAALAVALFAALIAALVEASK